jgi:hypothetical protein
LGEREAVRLIMARVPKERGVFASLLHACRLLAATDLALEKLSFRTFLQDLSRGDLKLDSCNNAVSSRNPNEPKITAS